MGCQCRLAAFNSAAARVNISPKCCLVAWPRRMRYVKVLCTGASMHAHSKQSSQHQLHPAKARSRTPQQALLTWLRSMCL
jgi:hypothetical protein